jgi:hypothetical protein
MPIPIVASIGLDSPAVVKREAGKGEGQEPRKKGKQEKTRKRLGRMRKSRKSEYMYGRESDADEERKYLMVRIQGLRI